MDLYLQFGHGMMEHTRHLLSQWNGGTVILSPRDLDDAQLSRLAADVNALSGSSVLLDPQFYLPHADHERLCSHAFWPSNYDTHVFWQSPELATLLGKLLTLNQRLNSRGLILPGLLATVIDDDWLEIQRATLEEATALGARLPLFGTIALSADSTRDETQIATLLERAAIWQQSYGPAGYYIVCEHPNGDYLVEDPNWLANVTDLVAGFRLLGAQAILGYCNHQMLIAAAAKVTAICSGTWMNVRSFPPDKFSTVYDEEIKKRSKWYYCPQSLSEYKIPFLDIAFRQNLLASMAAPPQLGGGYASQLFAGAQPSSVDFSEQAAFRHYLNCLRGQVLAADSPSFDDAIAFHEQQLDNAERLLSTLAAGGVRGQQRDFSNCVDVNRAALAVLTATRAAMLRHRWGSL